jgi:putative ubiquitin-RnfH superfamily antitoxin RatB of RatAB toxin-antitoxin module
VGIFGRIVDLHRAVVAGDRIEIYRPLTADPKEARRRRARGG